MKKLLAIEDEPTIGLSLRLLLREHVEFFLAQTGNQGLDLIVLKCPDIVLIDFSLPDMDGEQVLRRIQELKSAKPENYGKIRLVLATGYSKDDEIISAALKLADSYISKPYNKSRLLEKINA